MKLYDFSIIHPVYWAGYGPDNGGIAVGFLEWTTDFSVRHYGCTNSRSYVLRGLVPTRNGGLSP